MAVVLLLVGAEASPVPGSAVADATISVTTTSDELAIDGNCSLREAIQAANAIAERLVGTVPGSAWTT